MAYIGANPQTSLQQYLTIDDISGSFNGVLTSFALQVGGVAPVPGPSQSNQLLISLGGVIQEPDDTGSAGFRLSGGNIIFSSAPASSTAFFGVVLAGADYIYAGTNFPDGSVSTPSITFANDLDSGFYRTGSGEIAYTANGTFRLKIDSSGRLGVGTSSPQATLQASNTSGTVPQFLVERTGSASGQYGFYLPNDSGTDCGLDIYDDKANASRIRISSTGNVGVGTTSPVADLDIAPANSSATLRVQARTNTSPVPAIELMRGTNTTFGADIYADYRIKNDNAQLTFEYAASGVTTERLRIDSNGRVGIGTSSPGSYEADADDLVVANTGGNAGLTIHSASTGVGSIYFADGTTGTEGYRGRIEYNQSADHLSFGTASGGSKLRIDSSGNVGIGTTSPNQKLDVNGNIKLADSGTGASFITGTKAGNSFYIGCDNSTGSIFGSGTAYSPIIFTGATAPITFSNSGTEKVRIDSSGRLLVGTNTGTNVDGFGETKIQCKGDYTSSITVINTENNGNLSGLIVGKVRSSSIVQNNDPLGGLYFQGYDGSSYEIGASVLGYVDGTPGTNDMPTRLVFSTTADGASSPTERLRIHNDGYLYAISTASNNTNLTLRNNSAGADTTDFLQCRDNANNLELVIKPDGDVENANNSYTGFSDVKLKENIVDASSQWEDIKALRVRNYNYKESTGYSTHKQIGVIAQELELVSPGLVKESIDTGDGPNGETEFDLGTTTKSVNYSVLYMKAVKALQEAMERIETLEAKVAALEAN